ncbi:glucosyltransferase [Leuconostoc carnosum]|uniref:glycoside hydrolase family 70 protein n=1 Tax=Leuconostoc carnosum TaxID=1252 RepID=UPI001238EA77|nr:glycoside hydrolase family 70 protein [Leuconostoc carnosum]KAA8370830.1 glucosyltransferase [Leuconostoc carnosum]KAA8382472.1 glucosyltransferase [Leuconostoc carnosum]
MRNKETTCRKKLYKSGKLWVTAGLLSSLGLGLSVPQVYADTTQSGQIAQVKVIPDNPKSVQNSDNDHIVTTDVPKDKKVTDNNRAVVVDQSIANQGQPKLSSDDNPANKVDKSSQLADANKTEQKDTVYNVVVDQHNDGDSANKADKNGQVAANDIKKANQDNNPTPLRDKNSADDRVEKADQVDVGVKPDENQAPATNPVIDSNSDQDNKKETSSNKSISTPQDEKQTASLTALTQYNSKNIQTIDGKTYYIDDNGQKKKNFTTIVDGHVLYFDKDNGFLVPTNDYQFKEGLTSQNNNFTKHNAVHGDTADNFTEIDGYLTADSWYRPKDILINGKDWTSSSNNDFRPLLMTWWPDKVTQINYLNYMKSIGLSNSQVEYSNQDSQSVLNQAAQDVQIKIEQKISHDGQTEWLKNNVSDFVKRQPNWNIASEYATTGNDKDHLQGGALLYVNSDKTPDANSDYRLLNRTPTNQKGYYSYSTDPTQGGYDFLLANDVDNSNPAVQAEQLNWMYYLLNLGSITNQDADANFDSIRVDAVDNVDADLLQIAADYMKAAYGVDKSDSVANQHLSILEDWSDNDAEYVKDNHDNQLSMDNKLRLSLKYSLTMPTADQNGNSVRSGLEPLITNSLVDRTIDTTNNVARPNYSFVRAHDSEVQTVIAEIIKQRIDPNSDGLTPTLDQLTQAFKIYNADQLKTSKEFTQYNIPSTYALLLTNKDTVPRAYYGDLFTDDGQYMANKSPYYDAINTLLQSRLKYVAGGQQMAMHYMAGDSNMPANGNRGVLTSVRYGKGTMTADEQGTNDTRTQGIAVIEANNPDLKLNQLDQVVVKMGAAHKNQAYRPVLLTTKNGIATYISDSDVSDALIKYTNNNGELTFDASEIKGFANSQVSGYLAVWVPVGADNKQTAVTESYSVDEVKNGQTFHSNAALDSQVIYEGFSNFQSFPTNEDEYANVIIAKNSDLYKSWGITSFEFPPQYRSSTEGGFLDSIIQNGYAFTDRYDLGFDTPTKYGTIDQLRAAIKSLHQAGIQAMADWVPDQIYNLTGQQIVTAQRVNNSGIYNENSVINKTLYAAQTVGGGEYQKLYGGEFLDTIKKLYPSLFTTKQISTGVPMDPSEKIKEWSAKYFNGSNIQGRGAYYVLKDWATNDYFKVSSPNQNQAFLPKQLLNQTASTGFVNDNKGMTYFSTSGYQAKDTFIQDEQSNWYYFNKNGYMTYGFQKINGFGYYFLPNGIELQDAYMENSNGNVYYFNKQGKQLTNVYFMDDNKQWHYFDKNGTMANKGMTTIHINGEEIVQYFNQDGVQAKDQFITTSDGKMYYFSDDSGDMISNQFKKLADGSWAYFGSDGSAIKGSQQIKGQALYFDDDYRQIKGREKVDTQGLIRYYNADSGEMIVNRFEKLSDGSWAYFGVDGVAVKGNRIIEGQNLFFADNYSQVKGKTVTDTQGRIRYYDADSGEMIVNRFEKLSNGSWAYFGADGLAVKGYQTINGQQLYFDDNYAQIKGQEVVDVQGRLRFFDADSGEMVVNQFRQLSDGSWAYFGADGVAVKGHQTINGKKMYFDNNCHQVKGQEVIDSQGSVHYYDADSGEMVVNQSRQLSDGTWRYFDIDGKA